MRIIKLLSIALSIALFVIACNNSTTTNQTANTTTNASANTQATPAATPAPSPADALAAARTTYAAECARCHGINGDGGTVTVMKKKLKVPSLRTGHALNHSEDELAKQIRDGGDGMPPFGDRLKPEEITGLVRLIRQELQGGAAKK